MEETVVSESQVYASLGIKKEDLERKRQKGYSIDVGTLQSMIAGNPAYFIRQEVDQENKDHTSWVTNNRIVVDMGNTKFSLVEEGHPVLAKGGMGVSIEPYLIIDTKDVENALSEKDIQQVGFYTQPGVYMLYFPSFTSIRDGQKTDEMISCLQEIVSSFKQDEWDASKEPNKKDYWKRKLVEAKKLLGEESRWKS